MQIALGKRTGVIGVRKGFQNSFILMLWGWELSYSHYLEDSVAFAWNRRLVVGKRKWWFTPDWKVWAKKDKRGLRMLFGSDRKQQELTH